MTSTEVSTGLVFDIVRYMIEDGPGIRTCVFFKGCPLRCKWCSNALGLEAWDELAYISNKCLKCHDCLAVCSTHALSKDAQGYVQIDYTKCNKCGDCVQVCESAALQLIGKKYSVDELMKIVERDRVFYRREGGGVTVTGGEILMQAGFVYKFLKKCRESYISTAIETSAYGQWNMLEPILGVTDFIFIDLKHLDSKIHFELTGVGNESILKNIQATSVFCLDNPTKFIIRIPIVTGLNDDLSEFIKTAKYLQQLQGVKPEVNLLPYHPYGINKYCWVGKNYELQSVVPPSVEHLQNLSSLFIEKGLKCTVGGSEVSSFSPE